MNRRIEIENLQYECRELLEKTNLSIDEDCEFQDRITCTSNIQTLEKIKEEIENCNK